MKEKITMCEKAQLDSYEVEKFIALELKFLVLAELLILPECK